MKPNEIKKNINYWQETAKHDYETMLGLFKIKRYSECLFFGHIILEKILKAFVVKKTKEHSPYIHNLSKLAEIAKIDLKESELDFLARVNKFNIRARYPDDKMRFYKICTKKYTEENLSNIKNLYKKLCQKLK